MKESQKVFIEGKQNYDMALGERRKLNLQKVRQFYLKRLTNQKERLKIYNILQTNLFQKIKYTLNLIKGIINYFINYFQVFDDYLKGSEQILLKEKSGEVLIYKAVLSSMQDLVQFNRQKQQKVKKLIVWVQKMLIPNLYNLEVVFNEGNIEIQKQMSAHFTNNEKYREQEYKQYQKLEGQNDLLEKQLIWFERIKKSDEITKTWGNQLYKKWIIILDKETQLLKGIQKNILDFADKFTEVYYQPQIIKGLVIFWKNIDGIPTFIQILMGLLNEEQINFIKFGSNHKKFIHCFQSFINLQNQVKRSGNPIPLIKTIQNKRFLAKFQNSSREWIQISVLFTIDKNVLFFCQEKGKILKKLSQKGLSVKRLSLNIVEFMAIEQGFLWNSTKKQCLHFVDFDKIQQFECYVRLLKQ